MSRGGYWRRSYGARTWKETAWSLVGFPLGVAGFVFVVSATSISVGLAITFVGIPLLAFTLWACRQAGRGYRGLARELLDLDVPQPSLRPRRHGVLGRLGGTLSEPVNWRSWIYLVIRYPLGVLGFAVAMLWIWGLELVTYPLWFWAVHSTDHHGHVTRGWNFWTSSGVEDPGPIALVVVAGIVVLVVAPWLVHGVANLERWLARALLGPTRASLREQTLESTRSAAMEDAATTLRRIERDLHDGTQAQLVALAMQLDLARAELGEADTPEAVAAARHRLDAAHRAAKDTLAGLRDVVRGIHPPALDAGLDTALTTLVARSSFPVRLRVDLDDEPSPVVASIAYYSAAELLTNVARHSAATHTDVTVTSHGQWLRLTVTDDGRGGAHIVDTDGTVNGGSGLSGLRDRAAAVDGSLSITSPPGGPTTVTIDLPMSI